jgi:cysteine desulfurase
MKTRPIYLDYNATTPHDPAVIEAMGLYLKTEFGNPSSSHWYGIAPKKAVEEARGKVARLLNCQPQEIVFTSGGTEANNHAILGIVRGVRGRQPHIITSCIEHPAVLEVCRHLEKQGVATTYLPVDGCGLVDPDDVRKAIRPQTVLITIMHANNEVGTIQPIESIAGLARQRGICFHTDAAQSVGKIPADVQELKVDLLSVAGHKIYAPKGIGALYVRKGTVLEKFCHGAGQEKGARAGTENVLGIVGLGTACEIAGRDLAGSMARLHCLRELLYEGLAARGGEMRLNGHPQLRLPNTLSLSFKNCSANRVLEEIGLEVAASAGAACHSDQIAVSHVLEAMGLPLEWAAGTLRFSVGRMTREEEIQRAVEVVAAALAEIRQS